MKATDIMRREVLTVGPEASVSTAALLMVTHKVSGLPVVSETRHLLGMLTEGDLLRRTELGTEKARAKGWRAFFESSGALAAGYVHSHSRRVGDIMTSHVVTVTEDAALADIVALMEAKHIRRVPVVRDERLVGIISRADFVRILSLALARETRPLDDRKLEEAIRAEFASQPWTAVSHVDITAKDGTVRLDGIIFDEEVRTALLVAARNIAGQRSVEDHLVWAAPAGLVPGA